MLRKLKLGKKLCISIPFAQDARNFQNAFPQPLRLEHLALIAEAEDKGNDIFLVLHFYREDGGVCIDRLDRLVLAVNAFLDEHRKISCELELDGIPLAVILHTEIVDIVTLVEGDWDSYVRSRRDSKALNSVQFEITVFFL